MAVAESKHCKTPLAMEGQELEDAIPRKWTLLLVAYSSTTKPAHSSVGVRALTATGNSGYT